ncbi:MAG: glycosyltransferase 87 family protein, partial [Pirellulaceae bacterium]|nr:glycosyltransferase 87 family protein [Pirellulaceae bacterium]
MIETSGSANWRDRLAVALPWLTLAWIGVMLASLYWGFLNRFVIGSWHGAWGLDFFSVPRAWENLLAGESIYDTAASQFGPRPTATWYPYHPVLAVVVGSWTRQLPPAWSYLTFVAFSLALLAFSGWLLARLAKDRLTGRIMFASLFFGPAIYLMLFIGQMHIFTVLAMALIFAGIWQLQSEDGPACRRAEWLIAAGLLAAFFSKPVVALFLPTLLLVRETRRATLASLGVYLVVSLVFLYVPALNARGLNFIHWANILTISQSTKMMAHLGHIFELPMSENPEIFSLPTWVDHLVGGHVNPQVFRLPVLFVV